jgi:hypothetical protein
MTMNDGPREAALAALTDLVDTARVNRDASEAQGWRMWTQTWSNLADHLDRVRTTLAQEGDDYLPEAWGYVDSGRLTIARYMVRIDRRTR